MKTIRVVAAVIKSTNENDEPIIFATQRGYGDMKGGWEFPGGKIEPGETPQEALRREIMEELETEIIVGDLIHTIEYDYPNFHLSMDCFWCEIESGSLELKEHEDAKWLTKNELDSVDWLPADKTLIKLIHESIQNRVFLCSLGKSFSFLSDQVMLYAKTTVSPCLLSSTKSLQAFTGGVWALWGEANREVLEDYCSRIGNTKFKINIFCNGNSFLIDSKEQLDEIQDFENTWICLQVAQADNITDEIAEDYNLLLHGYQPNTDYKNRKGMTLFTHPTHLKNAAKYIYPEIASKYRRLAIVIVSEDARSVDSIKKSEQTYTEKTTDIKNIRKNRKQIERAYAKNFHAIYWR